MKNRFSLRTGLLALAGVMALGFGLNTASADSVRIGVHIGNTPPPRYYYASRPYPPPYPGYVWMNGRYVRPPHRGAVWVPARYVPHHGGYHYRPGYWR